MLIPVGGGGLAAGVAIALRALRPEVRLVGVQVRRDGYTIADGIAVKQPGELTMAILERNLDDLVEVDDEQISDAITLLLERSKLLVEGAGAVGVAALLAGKAGGSGSVCAVLSGGNIDPTTLISVLRHGMTLAGRYLVMRTRLVDRPGELIRLCQLVADERGNIVQIEHRREGVTLEVGDVGRRPDRRDAQRGALPAADRRARAEWLPGRAAALMTRRGVLRRAPRARRARQDRAAIRATLPLRHRRRGPLARRDPRRRGDRDRGLRAAAPTSTFTISSETSSKLVAGKQNPMIAYMTGKLKVSGDINAALELQSLLPS